MKFHVALPGAHRMPGQPEWLADLTSTDYQRMAKVIDEVGFDSISVPEHVAMPLDDVERLGPHWMHALSTMAFVLGATERVRVDTTVLVLPFHHPVTLAKAIATMDVLSGGRVNLGIGLGHGVAEFATLGVALDADRGRRGDEALAVIKTCWANDVPVFHGEFFHVDGVAFAPRPVQQPHPPITIGGNSIAALKRASRHEGWQPNPVRLDPADVPGMIEVIRSQPDFAGKESTFEVHYGGVGPSLEVPFGEASAAQLSAGADAMLGAVADMADLGVTATNVVGLESNDVDEYLDALRWAGEQLL